MNDYPCIRAWGRLLNSHSYYITDQVAQAKRDNAPADATYKDDDGHWRTLKDVTRADTKTLIERFLGEMRA